MMKLDFDAGEGKRNLLFDKKVRSDSLVSNPTPKQERQGQSSPAEENAGKLKTPPNEAPKSLKKTSSKKAAIDEEDPVPSPAKKKRKLPSKKNSQLTHPIDSPSEPIRRSSRRKAT